MLYRKLVASTTEMLRSTLGDTRFELLSAVARRVDPGSGRAFADELTLSPTTASDRLSELQEAGFEQCLRPVDDRGGVVPFR